MIYAETQLNRLKDYIATVNPCEQNVPVGITITASGNYFVVKYSLSQPSTVHKKLHDAILEIKLFIDEAERAKREPVKFENLSAKIISLRDDEKKSFKEIGKLTGMSAVQASHEYSYGKIFKKEKLDHWMFELPTRIRNCLIAWCDLVDKEFVKHAIEDGSINRAVNLGPKGIDVLKQYFDQDKAA